MEAKIRVYGKAQNRTALGVVHAYVELNPNTTLQELKKAFPDELNPDSGVKVNFKTLDEIKSQMENTDWNGYFTDEDCLITLADGTKVALVSMWTKPSYERLVKKAQQYGIVVAKMEKVEKGFGKKGGYSLEYIQPKAEKAAPVSISVKKKSKNWLWILLVLLVVALLLALIFAMKKEPKVVTIVQKDTVTVVKVDTVFVQQVEEIAKNFNAAQFALNSYELNDAAKFALHDLANVMIKNPQIKLLIKGHTSDDGNAEHNQVLSEKRAKAAVDFLVSQGVDASRLNYEGKGSSEPVDPNNKELNRRTEFIVVE